jgi:hypothetical protein
VSAAATAWLSVDDLGVHERQLRRWARESVGDPIVDGTGRPVGEITSASLAGGVLRLRAELDEAAGRGVAVAITEKADGSAVADIAAVDDTKLAVWDRDTEPRATIAERRAADLAVVERAHRKTSAGTWIGPAVRIAAPH